jgi:small subunit ribosomal protein S10
MLDQKLKIRLNANDSRALEVAAKGIVKAAEKAGCKVSGPIPLPMNIHKLIVNKSPHIDKKSREQFEIRNLSKLIIIHYPAPELIKDLTNFQLPPGVAFTILSERKPSLKVSGSKEHISLDTAKKLL